MCRQWIYTEPVHSVCGAGQQRSVWGHCNCVPPPQLVGGRSWDSGLLSYCFLILSLSLSTSLVFFLSSISSIFLPLSLSQSLSPSLPPSGVSSPNNRSLTSQLLLVPCKVYSCSIMVVGMRDDSAELCHLIPQLTCCDLHWRRDGFDQRRNGHSASTQAYNLIPESLLKHS